MIGAAIGSGNTALAAERGGADFLLAINAGRLRNMGAPSIACMLPIRDASEVTESFAREELLAQCKVPILLGVNVWGKELDPAATAVRIREAGFAGAVNFPSCMHYSRAMQQILARAGRGIEREVAQLRAVQEAGLTSMFYCATRTQARFAADAGIDLILFNLGWNVGGALGHRSRLTVEEAATMARGIGRLVKSISPQSRFLLEGGPIATPADLGRAVSLAPIDGYVGGSTIERMPLEDSVADQIDGFRQASKRRTSLDSESTRLVAWARQFGLVGRSQAHLAFLRRLRALAQARHPVVLLTERGMDTNPAIMALARPQRQAKAPNIVHFDSASEDRPTRALSLLFGQESAVGGRQPVLADDTLDLVVIHRPEALPAALQYRLAAALRQGGFRAPGRRRTLTISTRVVLICQGLSAENQLEDSLVGSGLHPELVALYQGWALRLPPLRERTDDLMKIIETEARRRLGRSMSRASFSSAAAKELNAHLWPGNETELGSLLGAFAERAGDDPIRQIDLLPLLQKEPLRDTAARSEKDRIVDALWRHGFNRSRTAEALGMSRKTLYNKMQKFGLTG